MAEIVTCPTCGGEAVLDSGVYQSAISSETLAAYEANVRRRVASWLREEAQRCLDGPRASIKAFNALMRAARRIEEGPW